MATRSLVKTDHLINSALELLAAEGAASLRVRRIAEAAGVSTMAVYSGFGSLQGLLEQLYKRGFSLLEDEMKRANTTDQPIAAIEALGLAYRRFALGNPGLYALMFEHPLLDFDPSPALRQQALETTFGMLIEAVERAQEDQQVTQMDSTRLAYLLWITTHGAVSLELTHSIRSPLPGWFLDSETAGRAVFLEALRATLAGLGPER